MNKQTESSNEERAGMDHVGRLIRHVGGREAVPGERMERARKNVQAHWERVVAEQRPARKVSRQRLFAAAAGIVMALGVTVVVQQLGGAPEMPVPASVDRVLGEALIAGEPAGQGRAVGMNTEVVTGAEGRIALRMAGGQSLRVDTTSRVTIHSPNHVSLDSGALYIDTAFAEGPAPILVSTPMGTAQDIGTQFQVRLTATSMVVGVRDGRVEVAHAGRRGMEVEKGHYAEFDADGGHAQYVLAADDPDWSWIGTVAPEFEIEGASLEQYLRWYAHEAGVILDWADEASERNAAEARLSGSIAGASVHDSLEIVQRIAPFEYRLSQERLWIRVE
jgi:ferric-dicitrate binding protein FerR (iron transport regulator)